jgi:hypothetical protein
LKFEVTIKRSLAIALLSLLPAGPAAAQELVTSVVHLQFYSSFWMNLHHRLHADARDKKNRVDVSRWAADDGAAWNTALEVYKRELAQRDLRTGRDMTQISGRLSGAGNSLASLGLSDDHRRALEGVASAYRARLWPDDDKRNRAWIEDVTRRLEQISAGVLPQLEAFFRMPWYSATRTARIDIVYVGNARGGYTWVYPDVHTVIDAADATYQGWLGVEMTLHEASHGLTDPLTAALEDVGRKAGKDAGALWHPVQFFVVGEVMRRTLAANGVMFTSYLYQTGLFDRAWAQYKGAIETYVGAWLDKRLSWNEAITELVAAI